MIKLFTLENLSAFSSDAVYKACLALDSFGVSDENILTFQSYENLLESAQICLQNGDCVVVAVENNDYNDVKSLISSKFSLEQGTSEEVGDIINRLADTAEKNLDFGAHCAFPASSTIHLSNDGLYSGFSMEISEGIFGLVPLDFSRIDSVLFSFISTYFEEEEENEDYALEADEEAQGYDYKEPVSKMIYSLMQADKKVAIATGEATMKIYNLYNEINGLSDVVNFVEIVDEKNKDEKEPLENETQNEDDNQDQEEEKETAVEKTIRFAMEAKENMKTDFGAAISDVCVSENENGEISYYAFIAIADSKTTKVKKINTSVKEEAILLLPHCVTVLSETVCQKVDAIDLLGDDDEVKKPKAKRKLDENKKVSKEVLIIAAIILVIAAISPIIMVKMIVNSNETTTLPPLPVIATGDVITTLPSNTTTTSPTSPFPGISAEPTTLAAGQPAEPPASEVSVATTSPNVSSSKGTFTFYVFGYGHGVGMSQNGANYLANQGWNYAQILANYYYGTTLVSGDTYPETIKYNGTAYKTRDYLAGVLEGEMGASFHKEALKAQAVAAYTFAKYYGFSLTTDSNAYKTNPSEACYAAVDEVMKNGLYIAYGGLTALTPFHSISAGLTTSYYNAWGGTALPYLSGGRPSYGDYNANGFKTTYTITSDELKSYISSKNLGITLSGDPATWISVLSHDACINENVGYVSSVSVGGKIMSGNEFRIKVLDGKIRSHCFMVVYTPN